MIKIIGTFFYAGFFPFAPGTIGSLLGMICGIILFYISGLNYFIAITVIVFFLGWWASNKTILKTNNTDPSEIVIDEVVGQWIGLIPIFIVFKDKFNEIANLPYQALLVTFILFRIFDIIKIGPIKWADELNNGFGVMFDDVLAGIATGLIMIIYLFVS
jgi:phosphatidylglycerophosphatase A